ncbi:MAG TPA: SRPBCC domain-containing protein [Usitatibacter sp.]|nr:SRPBCC domain-containing protein [Usitatibacter sp.]
MRNFVAAAACSVGLCTYAFHGEERRIVKEVMVKAPVEAVWKAWTTSGGVQSFFGPEARIEARPEGAFHVHFNPYAPPGSKGADDMRVLAVQENQLISFTWNAPPHLPAARAQRTFVAVRMHAASPTETHLRLTHTGWGDGGEWDQAFAYFERAWGTVLGNLQKRFAEGPVDWAPMLARMKAFQDEEDRKSGRKP